MYPLTPWVRRLLIANVFVFFVQYTMPAFTDAFVFVPRYVLFRPWTIITYMFLHAGFSHILFNMLGLFFFGPRVEERLGSKRFAQLYFVSGISGALLSVAFAPYAAIIGASAAVFGVMLAFVLEWPDAPVLIFPLPFPVKAKWVVLFLAGLSLVAGLSGVRDGVAHLAHLGGFAAALLYLRGSALLRRSTRAPDAGSTAVLVHPFSTETARGLPAFGPRRGGADAKVLEEVDRVLDKISAGGLSSLTPEERRFLDEMSKRFKQDH